MASLAQPFDLLQRQLLAARRLQTQRQTELDARRHTLERARNALIREHLGLLAASRASRQQEHASARPPPLCQLASNGQLVLDTSAFAEATPSIAPLLPDELSLSLYDNKRPFLFVHGSSRAVVGIVIANGSTSRRAASIRLCVSAAATNGDSSRCRSVMFVCSSECAKIFAADSSSSASFLYLVDDDGMEGEQTLRAGSALEPREIGIALAVIDMPSSNDDDDEGLTTRWTLSWTESASKGGARVLHQREQYYVDEFSNRLSERQSPSFALNFVKRFSVRDLVYATDVADIGRLSTFDGQEAVRTLAAYKAAVIGESRLHIVSEAGSSILHEALERCAIRWSNACEPYQSLFRLAAEQPLLRGMTLRKRAGLVGEHEPCRVAYMTETQLRCLLTTLRRDALPSEFAARLKAHRETWPPPTTDSDDADSRVERVLKSELETLRQLFRELDRLLELASGYALEQQRRRDEQVALGKTRALSRRLIKQQLESDYVVGLYASTVMQSSFVEHNAIALTRSPVAICSMQVDEEGPTQAPFGAMPTQLF